MKQMWQVTGYTNYSNHHPWIHTLLIKLLYNIGYGITKSPNFGVATYTLFQMIITCITFSYVIYILYKNNFNKLIVIIAWIFFFLFPFNAIYTITMWKDIPFSLIILAITTFIYDHYKNNGEYNLNKQITITTLSILMCLFRSNGFIAYFIFIIVLFILSKKDFIKLKYSILITIIVVFIFKGPIMNYFNVESSEFTESLSIPVQQIGYVIKNNGNLSNKDLEEFRPEKIANEIYEIYSVININLIAYIHLMKFSMAMTNSFTQLMIRLWGILLIQETTTPELKAFHMA